MKEYHKIDTLFMREETGKHRMIVGRFRNPAVEQVKDCMWQFTEKVDGTNIRIYWDGHKVSWGGRTENAQLHIELVKYIQDNFLTNEVEQLFEQKFGNKEVYLFCEGYGSGIQNGGGYRKDKSVILYDVYVNGFYLDREQVAKIGETFNIECVPVVLEGTIQEGIDFVLKHEHSTIAHEKHPLEGLVGRLKVEMRDADRSRMIVKIKRKDFLE